MSRGITASIMLICVVLAVSIMAQLGAYDAVNAGTYATAQGDDDVNRIIDAVDEPSGSITGVAEIDPFLGLALGAIDTAQIFWIVATDTEELVYLLAGGGGYIQPIAKAVETLVKIALGITFLYLMRGLVL